MKWENNFVVLDLETGGFSASKNPITEIAVIVLDINLNEILRYENYIKPYKGIDDVELVLSRQALEVTGIKESDLWSEGVGVKQLHKDLKKILKDAKTGKAKPILCGHNIANFDCTFLEYLFDIFEKRENPMISNLWKYVERFTFDTMSISRVEKGHVDVENHKLGGVCKRKGIELVDAHRALNDTEATAELVKAFILELRDKRVSSNKVESVKPKFRDKFKF